MDHLTTLAAELPPGDPDAVLETFTAWTAARGLQLYPHQEEALTELVLGGNVILSTPTGSGKSLVATGAIMATLAAGGRAIYTAPVKALVSEKFFDACAAFGAESVGMLTGDAAVNPEAPIICCTAEILAHRVLRGFDDDAGHAAAPELVVMDEFHFYADPDRGWAWQVPLLELPQTQFLLMSATLGDVDFFLSDLTRRTGRSTALVSASHRPVPLTFDYATSAVHDTIDELLHTGRAPIYVVHFTQSAAIDRAQALTSITVADRATRDQIGEQIAGFRFAAGFGKTLNRLLRHGVGIHHAGMLPRYRRLVERLAQAGLLRVIAGTDTLGVGINVPIRTVLLTSLVKYDGRRTRQLSAREFQQIAGRAGRAGYDTAGTVVVQAPEHEVENARLLARAGDDEAKKKRIVRRKPAAGQVNWSKGSFDRLIAAEPERLTPQLRLTHAMLLNLLARRHDRIGAARRLLLENHQNPSQRRELVLQAVTMLRSLLAAGIVHRVERDGVVDYELTVDLPEDFALNQQLGPFALAALDLLDPDDPGYALNVVSVIESTLDDPRQVLMAQRRLARGEAVAAMKAEGLDYDERMALLEDITHPMPLAETLGAAFDIYRRSHPWVSDYELSPKSVVRDAFERAMSFPEYIKHLGLERSEGTVLRYFADAHRALTRSVPAEHRTEQLDDVTEWLAETVRQTDSSLVEEWAALVEGATLSEAAVAAAASMAAGDPDTVPPLSANPRALRVMVRNAIFRRVELAALGRWQELAELDADLTVEADDIPLAAADDIDPSHRWDADDWADAIEDYEDCHGPVPTGAAARGPHLFTITPQESQGRWWLRQILDDPDGDHDWAITAVLDLAATDEQGQPQVRVLSVGA